MNKGRGQNKDEELGSFNLLGESMESLDSARAKPNAIMYRSQINNVSEKYRQYRQFQNKEDKAYNIKDNKYYINIPIKQNQFNNLSQNYDYHEPDKDPYQTPNYGREQNNRKYKQEDKKCPYKASQHKKQPNDLRSKKIENIKGGFSKSVINVGDHFIQNNESGEGNNLKINENKSIYVSSHNSFNSSIRQIKENKKNPEVEIKRMKELEKKKLNEKLERESIIDRLKCYICLTKVRDPLMCPCCKKLACKNCLKEWMSREKKCGNCKQDIGFNNLIDLKIMNEIGDFMMNQFQKADKNEYGNSKEEDIKIKEDSLKNEIAMEKLKQREMNDVNEEEENEDDQFSLFKSINKKIEICIEHNQTFNYYCFNCRIMLCKECLSVINPKSAKHKSHTIIKVKEMKKYNIEEAVKNLELIGNKARYLEKNEDKINPLIKNMSFIKEETMNVLDQIREEYRKMMDEKIESLKKKQNELKGKKENMVLQKDRFLNSIKNAVNIKNSNECQTISRQIEYYVRNIKPSDIVENIDLSKETHTKCAINSYNSGYIYIKFKRPLLFDDTSLELVERKELNNFENLSLNLIVKHAQEQINWTMEVMKTDGHFNGEGGELKTNLHLYPYLILKNKDNNKLTCIKFSRPYLNKEQATIAFYITFEKKLMIDFLDRSSNAEIALYIIKCDLD